MLRLKNWEQKTLLMCQVSLCADRHAASTPGWWALMRSCNQLLGAKRLRQEEKTSLPSVLCQSAALSELTWWNCTCNKCPRTTLHLLFAFHCWTILLALHWQLFGKRLQHPGLWAHVQGAANTANRGIQPWLSLCSLSALWPATLQALSWSRSLDPHDSCCCRQQASFQSPKIIARCLNYSPLKCYKKLSGQKWHEQNLSRCTRYVPPVPSSFLPSTSSWQVISNQKGSMENERFVVEGEQISSHKWKSSHITVTDTKSLKAT